jgi:hypothetical protein
VRDQVRRRQIPVLDEDLVRWNQAVVQGAGLPSDLALERRDRFVMPFDGRDRRQRRRQRAEIANKPLWRRKAGLDVGDEQGLTDPRSIADPVAETTRRPPIDPG